MSIAPPPTAPQIREGDQRVVLRGIGWEGYATLLRLKGERREPKMIYLDGSVILVSPSRLHERMTRLLGLFVFVLAEELDVASVGTRSTTFRRGAERGGVEPDESFYFSNLDFIRGRREIDLETDPPPDLAIEAVVSHDADDAIEVYRRLGIPEVWVCDEDRLTILCLGADGRYAPSDRSTAFSVLEAGEIHHWATRDRDESDQAWARELRGWVRRVLVPRRGTETS